MIKTRVLVVKDNQLLVDGVIALLNSQPDVNAAASGTTNRSIQENAQRFKPHVALVEIGSSNQDSLKILRLIRRDAPSAGVILMDLVPGSSSMMEFLKEGVSGFIHRDATLDEFLSTIRLVAKGEKVVLPALSDSFFSQIIVHANQIGDQGRAIKPAGLTKREQDVIDMINAGRSNKEIAATLYLSIHTVKSHIHSVLEKLGLHSRLELAHFNHVLHKAQNP